MVILHGKGFMTAEFFSQKTLFAKYLCGFTDSLDKRLENKFESSWRQTEYYGWNIRHVFPDPLFPYIFTCGHFWRHYWVIQIIKQVWLFLYVMKTRWILDLLTCCESIREYGFSSCMEFRKKKKKKGVANWEQNFVFQHTWPGSVPHGMSVRGSLFLHFILLS